MLINDCLRPPQEIKPSIEYTIAIEIATNHVWEHTRFKQRWTSDVVDILSIKGARCHGCINGYDILVIESRKEKLKHGYIHQLFVSNTGISKNDSNKLNLEYA